MKCIGLTRNKNICKKTTVCNNIYCNIHKNKYKKKNTLNSIKPIIKREIIKTISHKSKELLSNKEILHIHNLKLSLTNDFKECYICNQTKNLTIDHIIPIVNEDDSEFGRDNDSNSIICCLKCNMNKSNKGLEFVLEELKVHNKNKILNQKIHLIKEIYKYKNKLLIKKKFIHNFSFYMVNNIFSFYNTFISKYMRFFQKVPFVETVITKVIDIYMED